MRLHWVVVLDGDAVLGLYLYRRVTHRLFRIAARLGRRKFLWHSPTLAHRLSIGYVGLRVVGDFDEARCVARLLVGFCDHEGHGLAIEEDFFRLERSERLVRFFLSGARRCFLARS